MSLFKTLEDDVKQVLDSAVADAEAAPADVVKRVETEMKTIVSDVLPTLEDKAMSLVISITKSIDSGLQDLLDLEKQLKAEIDSKGKALTTVSDTIAQLQRTKAGETADATATSSVIANG